jgi:hypothetical protein
MGSRRTHDKRLCADVAADLRGAGLRATPSLEQARLAGNRLDRRLTQVADPGLHDAVVRLHRHLHAVEIARRGSKGDEAARSAAQARDDVAAVARACKTSTDALLS